MRAVLQRVSRASVRVDGEVVGEIGAGLCVFVGVRTGDRAADADWLAEKIANVRVFPDDEGRLNRSLADTNGEALVVSQFTLYADARRGRRPSFGGAATADIAEPLVRLVGERLRAVGVRVSEGRFGATMQVELSNEGPVTLVIDTPPERDKL